LNLQTVVNALVVVTIRQARSPKSLPDRCKATGTHRIAGNTVAIDFNIVRCPNNVRKLLAPVKDFDVRKWKHWRSVLRGTNAVSAIECTHLSTKSAAFGA
jgi:hypothetical protein